MLSKFSAGKLVSFFFPCLDRLFISKISDLPMSISKSIAAKAVQNMEADHIFVFEKRIWNFSVSKYNVVTLLAVPLLGTLILLFIVIEYATTTKKTACW